MGSTCKRDDVHLLVRQFVCSDINSIGSLNPNDFEKQEDLKASLLTFSVVTLNNFTSLK